MIRSYFEELDHKTSYDDSGKSDLIDVCDCCGGFWKFYDLKFSTTTMYNLCPICYDQDQES